MTYLEARRVVDSFAGGEPLQFILAMSGMPGTLELFIRASAAQQQRSAEVRTLPFNTLGQRLASAPSSDAVEVWLLFPWDMVPEIDWRSGMPTTRCDPDDLSKRAQLTTARLAARRNARLVYVAAPHLPLFPDPAANASLSSSLLAHAQSLGARILAANHFALGTYLTSGCPIAATALDATANVIVSLAAAESGSPRKLLITDFDNVLWKGSVADEGANGVFCAPEGVGFRHFLYQSLLVALKNEGVLLAGVSRNSEEDALSPLRSGVTLIGESDLIATLSSYHPKSAQIQTIAERLNIGLDDVVFIDDGAVELAEVSVALPPVRCVRFPDSDDDLHDFFQELRRLFARSVVTKEDRERTELYRRRAAGLVPAAGAGADLREFLKGLDMRLTVYDRGKGSHDRALQLINKTNQFNINGVRIDEAELLALLSAGGRLYTADLVDRTGSHGEILSCLISRDRIVEAFVLSCRVFQRRVEYAFVGWLAQNYPPVAFRYSETSRNEPARTFFQDAAFVTGNDGRVAFAPEVFLQHHQEDMGLHRIEVG